MNATYQYEYLFFDIDHTLWDFEKNSYETLQDLYQQLHLNELGIPTFIEFEAVYHQINATMWERFRKGFMTRNDLRWKRMWQTLLHFNIYNTELAKEMSDLYLKILPTKKELFPHAKSTLDYCKQKGYQMHLITNGFEATQIQKLKNASIEHYFDELITSEMAMSIKPQKAIFDFALKKTNASVEKSLMIGDALEIDIQGAMNVGMSQVFFNPTGIQHSFKPTYEIHCLADLKNFL